MSMSACGITNFYESMGSKYSKKQKQYKNFANVQLSIPNRMMLVGSSGSGKSNVLLNIIYSINAFTKVYLLVKSPDEPLYQFLTDEMRAIEKKLNVSILTVSTSLDDLPEVDDFDKNETTLVVLDDIISERDVKLKKVADLWIRSRKSNVTTIFLTQSYTAVPKLIRQNTDVVILKKIGTARDLSLILSEYSLDKSLDELKAIYKACRTNDICSFMLIDLSPGQKPELMYRHNFAPIESAEKAAAR